jgi:hypothetical protein
VVLWFRDELIESGRIAHASNEWNRHWLQLIQAALRFAVEQSRFLRSRVCLWLGTPQQEFTLFFLRGCL